MYSDAAASGGVSGVAGTGDMGSHSDSNSPVTPFGGHPMMAQVIIFYNHSPLPLK